MTNKFAFIIIAIIKMCTEFSQTVTCFPPQVVFGCLEQSRCFSETFLRFSFGRQIKLDIMEKIVRYLCFLLLCVPIMEAKRLKDRFDIMEKRMDVVEIQINADRELKKTCVSLQQNFEELSASVINLKDEVALKMGKQTGKEMKTVSEETDDICKASRMLASLGIEREKKWLRDQVETLTHLMNEQNIRIDAKLNLLGSCEDKASDLEIILANINKTVQTELRKMNESITRNIKLIDHLIYLKIQRTEMTINAQNQEIENLKEILVASSNVNSTTSATLSCLPDWTQFSSHCYLLVKEKKSFFAASARCHLLGATLADFESREASAFIVDKYQIQQDFWIGYSDEKQETKWISERTGQPAQYINFADGQPNGGIDQNCVGFGVGSPYDEWYDLPCEDEHPYFCKKGATIVRS
ncbi:C-type lectin domain family 4 member M-like [Ruditapes philippinarum]|uniref:C-type lectin domain family 4 member M-like n=1 Tax=Ruditapes philippinarum TaxID=129788 RepID=UPI00295B22C4|nr:C-type lectin domain family 4 member M-like [Ruditapes philippinarum]